jgi:hypothetical protein
MPIEEIAQKVSDRYAKAASTGEQLCGSAGYDMAQLKSLIPEEALRSPMAAGHSPGSKP